MRDGNVMMKLWFAGFTLLECIKEDFDIDESALSLATSRLCEVVDPGFIEKCMLKENLESKFSCLQRITLDLLDIADKVFHRKD